MMHWFFLAALLALAAVCGLIHTSRKARADAGSRPPEEADVRTRWHLESSGDVERLAGAVEALLALMDHPQLGGPGFLSIQFPPLSGSCPAVSAQFPNIREALYRRIVRQELDQADLLAAGVPAALFTYHLEFATESGGMVLVTAGVPDLEPALLEALAGRRDGALSALAEALERRCPGLSVRPLGPDLLLTPARETASAGISYFQN